MLEARFTDATLLKKVLDAIKDLVTDANWDCSSNGISLQAMDSSHVSLVSILLSGQGMEGYRCDRNQSLGINILAMTKIMKCADNSDSTVLRAEDEGDSVSFTFESQNSDKVSNYEMKLMDIDGEHLGIPQQEYQATVTMRSTEFQRIIRDLGTIGDAVEISVDKEGIKFAASGDSGKGTVTLRSNPSVDDDPVTIDLKEDVSLTFALRYLSFFTRATSLSDEVVLSLSSEAPLNVEYQIAETGYVRYYLAPKLGGDEEEN